MDNQPRLKFVKAVVSLGNSHYEVEGEELHQVMRAVQQIDAGLNTSEQGTNPPETPQLVSRNQGVWVLHSNVDTTGYVVEPAKHSPNRPLPPQLAVVQVPNGKVRVYADGATAFIPKGQVE